MSIIDKLARVKKCVFQRFETWFLGFGCGCLFLSIFISHTDCTVYIPKEKAIEEARKQIKKHYKTLKVYPSDWPGGE